MPQDRIVPGWSVTYESRSFPIERYGRMHIITMRFTIMWAFGLSIRPNTLTTYDIHIYAGKILPLHSLVNKRMTKRDMVGSIEKMPSPHPPTHPREEQAGGKCSVTLLDGAMISLTPSQTTSTSPSSPVASSGSSSGWDNAPPPEPLPKRPHPLE